MQRTVASATIVVAMRTGAKRKAVELLARGASAAGTARVLHVHRSTVSRWLGDPAFAAEVEDRRSALASQCTDDCSERTIDEVCRTVLRSIAEDRAASASSRVAAAKALSDIGEHPENPETGSGSSVGLEEAIGEITDALTAAAYFVEGSAELPMREALKSRLREAITEASRHLC